MTGYVPAWYKLKIDKVLLEKKTGNIIPDVIAIAKGKELYIEIKVTHGVDDKKMQYIIDNELSVVEYDFSKMKNIVDAEHIKHVLTESYKGATKGKGLGRWINHLRLNDAMEEVTNAMKKHYPDLTKKT